MIWPVSAYNNSYAGLIVAVSGYNTGGHRLADKHAPEQATTIFDVARMAGVSYATVSRVLNNKDHVKPETRTAVLEAAAQLGYVASPQARSLAGGLSQIIGLLVQRFDSAYIWEIIRGIDTELDAAQYDLMLYTTHRRKPKELAYVTALARGLVDGLLLLLPRDPQAYLESLRRQRFPYVLIDHQGIGDYARSVGATNWQGAYDAARYLTTLGHRRIGFITGVLDLGCSVDRLAGYQAALREAGLPADPALIYPATSSNRPAMRAGKRSWPCPIRPRRFLPLTTTWPSASWMPRATVACASPPTSPSSGSTIFRAWWLSIRR